MIHITYKLAFILPYLLYRVFSASPEKNDLSNVTHAPNDSVIQMADWLILYSLQHLHQADGEVMLLDLTAPSFAHRLDQIQTLIFVRVKLPLENPPSETLRNNARDLVTVMRQNQSVIAAPGVLGLPDLYQYAGQP